MLKNIKDFLSSLKPDIIIQAPSRINMINPLDAVEGDFWMPSVAIHGIDNPLSVFLYIKEIEKQSSLKIYLFDNLKTPSKIELVSEERLLDSKISAFKELNNPQRLIYASIHRLIAFNSNFRMKYLKSNIEIGLLTTIPPQSGLGGSTAIIVALLYGLACYFNIYNNLNDLEDKELPINRDIIAEIATKVEDEDLKITAGYSDRYVISRGGICFCSYVGKLHHRKILEEPLAVYDRIDKTYEIHNLPIVVCFSGVAHESGDVHYRLRELYLKKDSSIINNYTSLAELSWKSRFAFMKHDWKRLGIYFRENTRIMNKIMKYAGFKFGIGLANNILIKLIEDNSDVYAAKLTGAGDGGSIFALVNPEKIESVLNYWKKELDEIIENSNVFTIKFPSYPVEIVRKLKDARFYQVAIDVEGVKKL